MTVRENSDALDVAIGAAQGLEDLYDLLAERRYTAGWHKARPSLWPEPKTPFAPLCWKYRDSAQLIDRAGQWIGTELAERRNLLMFNPVGDNDYASLATLVAAYQMIKPGEHARAHRHSPNALRLVLDAAPGAFTVVDGVQLPMHPGDILLTPSWTWHSHFNDGADNAYWIDILDVPLVHRLESMFFEPHPQEFQTADEIPASSPLRFSSADQETLLPRSVGHTRVLLDTPSLGPIRLALHDLGEGAGSVFLQRSANQVFAVIEGEGGADIGSEYFTLSRGDVFVVPIWSKLHLSSRTGARLLEVADDPVQELLGHYRSPPVAR